MHSRLGRISRQRYAGFLLDSFSLHKRNSLQTMYNFYILYATHSMLHRITNADRKKNTAFFRHFYVATLKMFPMKKQSPLSTWIYACWYNFWLWLWSKFSSIVDTNGQFWFYCSKKHARTHIEFEDIFYVLISILLWCIWLYTSKYAKYSPAEM